MFVTLIPWKCRKSQTAISKFKGSEKETQKTDPHQKEAKSIQVLLLLVQHGANGLNLLEAQHVILVEPLLNPAAEAQAVGRVHRIGQEKPTLVHRFLVRVSALFATLVLYNFKILPYDFDLDLSFSVEPGNGNGGRKHLQTEQK